MKLTIVSDNSLGVPMRTLCDLINARCTDLTCSVSDYRLSFDRKMSLNGDEEIQNLVQMDKISDKSSHIVYITAIPFSNNFFYEGLDGRTIISFYGWQYCTDLPISNGIIYFICNMILKYELNVGVNHDAVTGCMNDFMWDKSTINGSMRAAFYCAECRRQTDPGVVESALFKDLMGLLDFVSHMSRKGEDILYHAQPPARPDARRFYDAFLCHNSKDKADVRTLNAALVAAGVKTWFDEAELKAGDNLIDKLEEQIESVRNCVVVAGSYGQGPWQNLEYGAFFAQFVNRGCRLFPVIVGDGSARVTAPPLLEQFLWVDLRNDKGAQLAGLIGALRSADGNAA